MSGPNWRQYEQEEQSIIDAFDRGEIGADEYRRQMSELNAAMNEAYEQEREDSLRYLDDEWGRR
jgi:hypothetical protein